MMAGFKLPWYKCWSCDTYHWKNKNTFQVYLRNDQGLELCKYICDTCGNGLEYSYLHSFADNEPEPEFIEEDEIDNAKL